MIQSPTSGYGFEKGLVFTDSSESEGRSSKSYIFINDVQGPTIYGIRASSEEIDALATYAMDGNLSTYWSPEFILPDREEHSWNLGIPHHSIDHY